MTSFTVILDEIDFQKELDESMAKTIREALNRKVGGWDFHGDVSKMVKKHFDAHVEAAVLEHLQDADAIEREIKRAITSTLTKKINALLKEHDVK